MTALECSISSVQLGQYAVYVQRFKGLVQGERIGVASQGKDRFVSSRLLRCPVPRGQVKPRRREDISGIGVPVSRVQGVIGAQQEGLERLEEARSNKKQVALTKVGSL